MLEHEDRKHEKAEKDYIASIVAVVLPYAADTKQRLLKVGKREGHRKCPREGCDGTIQASLHGTADHIHMCCDNLECYYRLVE